ncbi:MAG: flagellar basal-body MS-ring/collar protein FliF [Fusobacteriota bacterium]
MEWFEKIKKSFLEIWNKLNKAQKIIISAGVGLFLIFVIILSIASNRVNYVPLFTELTAQDAAKVRENLDKSGIPYKFSGSTIEVPEEQKYSARLDLARDGALPTGGSVGFEIFDNTKIGATKFDKEMMFLRAQKGELEKTISNLSKIKRTSVTITPSNGSVFAEEKTDAKASILVQLEPFESLKPENVKSIMLLALSAVEDLHTDNIEVIDTEGNVLSDQVEFEEDSSVEASNKKLDLQKNIEKELERNIKGVLSALGGGNYRVKVSAELDFDKQSMVKEEYTTPTISGDQIAQGLIRSQQVEKEEVRSDTDENSQGVPGTDSNVPGYVGEDSEDGENGYSKEKNTVNYEMNKTNTTFEKSTGVIKRLTTSIVLNKKANYFNNSEFTEEVKVNFENMVKNAINFNENRGDSINVTAIEFNTETIDRFQEEIESREKLQQRILLGVVIIIGLAVLFGLITFIRRKIAEKKLREREKREMEEMIPDFETEGILGEQLSVEEQERKEQEEGIKGLAKKQPEDVANLIQTWLTEE